MSNNKDLLQKYKSQIGDRQNRIGELRKAIRGYGFVNCKKRGCFEIKKEKLESELNDIKDDILKAGSKYDTALVVALKNRQGRLMTKLNDVNAILVLFDKISVLKSEISDLEDEIKKLGDNIKPVYDERQQMTIVLRALRKNYCREDAAALADVEMKRIVNWIHEGRNRTNENKIYFFRQYSKIQSNKNRKIAKLLKHLKSGKTKSEACKLSCVSITAFDAWYNYGRLGKDEVNIDFYKKVRLISKSNGNRIGGGILREYFRPKRLDRGIQGV
ncbi:MAG: hypothetical protein Q4Q37_08740 [Methanobrevibacter sp.]|nr:hypothetical protein [Methanobrevibacter sp.]